MFEFTCITETTGCKLDNILFVVLTTNDESPGILTDYFILYLIRLSTHLHCNVFLNKWTVIRKSKQNISLMSRYE